MRRSRIRKLCAMTAVALVGAGLWMPGDTQAAGSYQVHQCYRLIHSPDAAWDAYRANPSPTSADVQYWMDHWQEHFLMIPADVSTFGAAGVADTTNECGTKSTYWSLNGAGYLHSAVHGYWGNSETGFQFTAPAGTTINSYSVARSVQLYPGSSYQYPGAFPFYLLTRIGVTNTVAERCFVMEGCSQLGTNGHGGSTFSENVAGSGVTGLRLSVGCRVYYTGVGYEQRCTDYSFGFAADLYVTNLEVELQDSAVPSVSNVAGTLADAVGVGSLKGTKILSLDAHDSESGVYRAVIELDGKPALVHVLDSNNGDCEDAGMDAAEEPYEFDRAAPCKRQVSGELELDTTTLTEGVHSLRVYVEDAAGNRKTAIAPSEVTVDNVPGQDSGLPGTQTAAGAAASCDPCNGSGGDPRTGRLVMNSAQSAVKTKYGKAVAIGGRLVDAEKDPIADAQVDVFQRIALPSESLQKVATVKTDGQGRFGYTPQTTSSRTVRFAFASRRGSDNYRDVADTNMQVRSTIKLSAKRRKIRPFGRMLLRGQVLASPLKQGVVVEIQVLDGKRWRTIAVKRTSPMGKLVFSYRFKRVENARFQFRALARASSDLPVDPTASKAIRIRVGN